MIASRSSAPEKKRRSSPVFKPYRVWNLFLLGPSKNRWAQFSFLGIDIFPFMLYYRYKLVRFTGVPLTISGVWRLTLKNKQRIKTNQCAPLGGCASAKKGSLVGRLPFLALIIHKLYSSSPKASSP